MLAHNLNEWWVYMDVEMKYSDEKAIPFLRNLLTECFSLTDSIGQFFGLPGFLG
jgi:hypothetical protein